MRLQILSYSLILSLCIGCTFKQESSSAVEALSPEVVVEEVHVRVPGQLMIADDFIVFQDMASADTILNVYDKTTGGYVTGVGVIGNGSGEFVSPQVIKGLNNDIFMRDLDGDYSAIYSLDGLMSGGDFCTEIPLPVYDNVLSGAFVSDNEYLMLKPENDFHLFRVCNRDKMIYSFGQTPLEKKIVSDNMPALYNGELHYNPHTEYMLCRFFFPLVHLYKKESGYFRLVGTKELGRYEFVEKEGRVLAEPLEPCRTQMACLTKNYVVLLDDGRMDEEKRESLNAPAISRRQLIALDQELKEEKVIDVNMDIFSIGSDGQSDTLYLLVADPDFKIVKVEL